jgi:hypothetical protein
LLSVLDALVRIPDSTTCNDALSAVVRRREVMRLRFPSALVVAGLALGGACAIAQAPQSPHPTDSSFRGIHRHKGVNGSAETVTVTDGKTYLRMSEQDYRGRGYAPDFEHLPTIFVQRLPVRIRSLRNDLD